MQMILTASLAPAPRLAADSEPVKRPNEAAVVFPRNLDDDATLYGKDWRSGRS